jgi:hypothetical protein
LANGCRIVRVATIDADRWSARPREALNRDNREQAAGVLEFSHAVLILQPARVIDTALVG